MSDGLAHRIAFHGAVRWGDLEAADGDLVVTDRDASGLVAIRPGDVFVDGLRPSRRAVDTVSRAIRSMAPERVVAVGGGCAIDTARLAWLDTGPDACQLVVTPCGHEMWRAFAAFAVVLDPPGSQTTTVDERLAGHDVIIDRRVVEAISDDTLLLTALDVLVAAAESLLTRKAQPYSRALAGAAGIDLLGVIRAGVDGGRPDAESVIVASALATEAFTSTGLGLAHAISTHLAALLSVPQDRINAIAGRWVLHRWFDHPALAGLRRAAGFVDPKGRSLLELFDGCLGSLRLGTLRGEGVTDGDVDVLLPQINGSSGVPWLPEAIGADEIRRVVLGLCDPEETDVRAHVG